MNKVLDKLFIGVVNDVHNMELLQKVGVKSIVNVAFDTMIPPGLMQGFADNGIAYYFVPLADDGTNVKTVVESGIEAIKSSVENLGVTFVCCHEGRSRSAMMIALYMASTGVPVLDALRAIHRCRPIAVKLPLFNSLMREFYPNVLKTPLPNDVPVVTPPTVEEIKQKESRAKLLLVSLSPQHGNTGTGNLSHHICQGLRSDYEIFAAGLSCSSEPYDGARVFPKSERWWEAVPQTNPDVLFLSHDIWQFPMLPNFVQEEQQRRMQYNRVAVTKGQPQLPALKVFGYFPIDADVISHRWIKILNACDGIATPSQFGRRAIRERFVKRPVFVIPEGVDKEFFSSVSKVERKAVIDAGTKSMAVADHEKYMISTRFVVLFVGINQEKKNFGAVLDGFCDFAADKTDVTLVGVVHSSDKNVYGENVRVHIDTTDAMAWKSQKKNTFLVQEHLPQAKLVNLFGASDLLVLPSMGEGFGLPVLEAMASCSLPCISAYSAHMEIPAFYFPLQPTYIRGMWNSVRAAVSSESVSLAFERAYRLWKTNRSLYERLANANRNRALLFTWERCTSSLKEALATMRFGMSVDYAVKRLL